MEALVAISVIVFAIVGPLSLAAKSLADSQFAKDQITAFYLAQDAIEWVHNMKDTTSLNGKWDDIKSKCVSKCDVDTISSKVRQCDGIGGVCSQLQVKSTGLRIYRVKELLLGALDYVNSRFVRSTTVTQTASLPTEYRITVNVSWQNGTNPRNLNISEYLYRD